MRRPTSRSQAIGIGLVAFVLVLVLLALTWVRSASDAKVESCSTGGGFDTVNGGPCEDATKGHELTLAGSVAVAFVAGMTVYSVAGRRLGATY